MKKILTIFFLLIFVACNKIEDVDIANDLPKIQGYSIESMLYPLGLTPTSLKVGLSYDENNQINQRIGHVVPVNPMSGYSYKFYEDVADTVRYFNDSIVITKQLLSNEDYTYIDEYKRKLVLENDLIIKEIYYKDFYDENNYDTLLYSYNNQRQIDEIIQLQTYSYKKNYKFKYDDDGNLSLITSERFKRDIPVSRDTIWFFDYDSSPNLAKNLNIPGVLL